MNLPAKRVLKLFGKILVVLAIGFVVWRLYFYAGEIDFSRFDGWRWCAILVLIFLSAIANALLARAWRQLLQNLGCRISVDQAVKIHGVSQLARYIPGNIFHLAGRQALGMAAGIDAKVLAKSTVWELALIALAASLFQYGFCRGLAWFSDDVGSDWVWLVLSWVGPCCWIYILTVRNVGVHISYGISCCLGRHLLDLALAES